MERLDLMRFLANRSYNGFIPTDRPADGNQVISKTTKKGKHVFLELKKETREK